MKRFLFLLLICTGFCNSIWAQATAALTVLEAGSKAPVARLRYELIKDGTGTTISNGGMGYTDENGQALINTSSLPATIIFYDDPAIEVLKVALDKDYTGSTIVLKHKINTRRINTLQETIVTGVPIPTRLKNALSQYRIINMEDSKAQGNITLADALSTQLNINVGNDGVLGSNVKMQGMSGAKIKILIDGLPVNGRENGNIDMGQLNLNNIARVEIVQGPMSVVYGSDALGGVINLITKKQTKPLVFNGGFNYEGVGKYNADAAITRSWQHHQLSLGGGRNYFNGWYTTDTNSYGPHRAMLWKPKEQYLANGAYTYTSDSGFKLQFASDFVTEKLTNRGTAKIDAFSGSATDEYYHTTRSNNRLILEGKLGKKGHWESKNSFAYYHRIRETVIKDLVSLNELPSAAMGDQDTSVFKDVNLRSNYSNTFGRLKYDAGYDVNLEFARSGKIPGGNRSIGDYAIYENFSHSLLKDKMTLQAGLRQTYNTQYSAPFIYSFQALYTPKEHVQLRASYAKGFRAPTLKEQYLEFIDQNHHIYGNPNLKAEQGDEVQVSASWQAYERRSNYVQFIVTGFYNNVHDQIVLLSLDPNNVTHDRYTYTNFDRMRNVIGNLQVEQQWNNLHLVLEYGLTHYWKQTGYSDYNVSELVGRAQYYWSQPGLSFAAFYKLNGGAPNVVQQIDGTVAELGKLPAYSMFDASVSRKFWKKRLELIAGVKNIFDVQQISSGVQSTGPHASDNGGGNFLPRRIFTTLRVNLY